MWAITVVFLFWHWLSFPLLQWFRHMSSLCSRLGECRRQNVWSISGHVYYGHNTHKKTIWKLFSWHHSDVMILIQFISSSIFRTNKLAWCYMKMLAMPRGKSYCSKLAPLQLWSRKRAQWEFSFQCRCSLFLVSNTSHLFLLKFLRSIRRDLRNQPQPHFGLT